jgi:hypothetical protein
MGGGGSVMTGVEGRTTGSALLLGSTGVVIGVSVCAGCEPRSVGAAEPACAARPRVDAACGALQLPQSAMQANKSERARAVPDRVTSSGMSYRINGTARACNYLRFISATMVHIENADGTCSYAAFRR